MVKVDETISVGELAKQVQQMYPGVELMGMDGDSLPGGQPGPRRIELLHALREAVDAAESGDVRVIRAAQAVRTPEPTADAEERNGGLGCRI